MQALRRPTTHPQSTPGVHREARDFLRLYHAETGTGGLQARLQAVRREIHSNGTYTLTPEELTYGCKVAWRNSTRCVGRAYWPYLDVRDLRHVTDPDEIFTHLVTHLHTAFGGGNIRPTISVFGPGVRIVNDQLIRYAGYRQPGGTVIGDPRNVPLTDFLRRHGWPGGPGTPFDVLPLAIMHGREVHLYPLPADAVHEVPITHPDAPAIGELGLKWHALPVISDLRLEIGGVSFPCAPFNGWYLQTEIAARNLADTDRYDQLPAIARALHLNTTRERNLWRDRALLELNVAMLHSFDTAGVKISDHHAVTRHFTRFEDRERRAGRRVHGRWSWLIPPLSPALTPVWHRTYDDRELRPNYFPQASVLDVAQAGRCPFH